MNFFFLKNTTICKIFIIIYCNLILNLGFRFFANIYVTNARMSDEHKKVLTK